MELGIGCYYLVIGDSPRLGGLGVPGTEPTQEHAELKPEKALCDGRATAGAACRSDLGQILVRS